MNRGSWDIHFRYFVLTFLVLLAVFLVWYFRALFTPLLIAALTAYFLSPVTNYLIARWRFRPKVAANVVYFLAFVLIFVVPFTVLPFLFDEFQNILLDLNKALDELQVSLANPIPLGNVSINLGSIIPALRGTVSTGFVPKPQEALYILEVTSRNFLWLLVVLVTAYYLMTDWGRLRKNLIALAPASQQSELLHLYRDIRLIWNSYLRGQVRLIFVLIIIYSVAWSVIGLPGAIALGILAGVLNLLPEVGPAMVAFLAVVVAFLEGSTFLPISNLWFAVLTLGLYFVLNNIKTIWLQPRILGHSVLLHEGLVFVAIVAAIILQGMLGVLIVVPLLATVAVVGRYLRAKILDVPPFENEEPAFMHNLEPDSPPEAKTQPRKNPARKKPAK